MFAKDDLDYVQGRIVGTIVSHKNEPVYITSVQRYADDIQVNFVYLKAQNTQEKDLIDALDMRPVKLGYMNFDRRDCVWFCRIPKRAWKQGLTNDHTYNGVGAHIDLTGNLNNLRDTVLGNYPTIAQASKSKYKKAFSRDFSVKGDEIYYKDFDCVGYYRQGNASLKDKYLYLREYLEEVLIANS